MTEDFNLDPASLEDKQPIMAKLGRNDFSLTKLGQIECGNCGEKFVNNGSITINGDKVTDLEFVMSKDKCIENKYIVIRRGKKKYYLGVYE